MDSGQNSKPPDKNSADQSKRIQQLIHKTQEFVSDLESEKDLEDGDSSAIIHRYEIQGLIGSGSMGNVFKAYEPKLQRLIALKFLRNDDAAVLEQFLREARLQARVEHDHVCRVYETGEMNGQPYIAMQLVNGLQLTEAALKMTLEEKLLVMKKVAEAVHAAHVQGLIHRDLKPANILAEDRAEGWHPYVMDFGLARDQEHPGATRTGIIVGSPSYMSPEQARGEIRSLDRRTDVYAMGATLYELLSGVPPFHGTSGSEVLVKILQQDVVPLRHKNSSIPRDIETIVMKCLEKDPALRYPSTRALGEDLDRYLKGDPITARPLSWPAKLFRTARKHMLVTATSAVAILSIALFSGLWLRERLHSIEQARLAQSFGQEASVIKSILRSAYTLPLHNLTNEKAIIYSRIKEMESSIQKSGPRARGPGLYAIGEGLLELGEYKLARIKLEETWKSNYQTPEVALALGRTLGHLYEIEVKKANELKENERQKQIRLLEKEFRDPSLHYLKLSEAAKTESPALWEGYINFYDHHYSEALKKTRHSMQQVPWIYEAWMLQGDIQLAIGIENQRKELWEQSLQDFQEASNSYRTALNIARSDPRLYQRDCERAIQVIEVKTKIERSFPDISDEELISCDRMVVVDPNWSDGYFQKSRIYFRVASARTNRGLDADAWFYKAIDSGYEAVKRNPADLNLYDFITLSYAWLAHLETEKGRDPTPILKKLIESAQKQKDFHMTAVAHHQMGRYQMQIGLDPTADFNAALKEFEQAKIDNPNSMEHYNGLGRVKTSMAEYLIIKGKDPGELIKKAISDFEKVVARFPRYPDPHNYLSRAFNIQALFEISRGTNAEELIQKAIFHANKSTELDPHQSEGYLELGQAFILKGKTARGSNATSNWMNALKALEKAVHENPHLVEGYLKAAETHLLLAEIDANKTTRSREERLQAQILLEKVTSLSPNHPELRRIKTRLE